jgi:hypothetical protein
MTAKEELIEALSDYIAEKRVDEKFALRLIEAPEPEQQALLALIAATNPSANTLRQFVRLAEEISLRDRVPLSSVLAETEIRSILAEPTSRKERQKFVRLALERRRYPLMSGLYRRLESFQREVLEKWGLEVEFPQDLEGDEISLTVSFRSAEELAKYSASTGEFAQSSELDEMFKLLKGECSEGIESEVRKPY